MGEGRRRLAREETCEPDLGRGRGQQVAAADDKVHRMTEVVHSDREAVRPVAVAVTNRHVAAGAGYLVGARTDELVHPAL